MSWFKKDTKYDTPENPGFRTLQKEYNWQAQTHKMLVDSKLEAKDVLLKSFTTELGKVGSYEASMFVKNGQFAMPKGYEVSGEEYMNIKGAYNEAMDAIYSKGKMNEFMVGAGSRVSRDLTFYSPDITNVDNPGVADVREFLRTSQKAGGIKENLTRVRRTGDDGKWTTGTKDENAILFEQIFNGELDINNINFNPITGADPQDEAKQKVSRRESGGKRNNGRGPSERSTETISQGNTGDWSRMEIVLDDGSKIAVDLNNDQTTKLFQKATNSTRANALNIVGEYEYKESGVLTGGGTDNPVKINRVDNSTLGVTGKIWKWDFDAERGTYIDLQEDVLDRLQLNFESPENLQVFADLAYARAKKDYDKYYL